MCSGAAAAVAGGGLGAISSLADYNTQKVVAKANAKFKAAQYEANLLGTANAYGHESEAVRRRQSEEREQIGAEIMNTVRTALGQRGFAYASQGEGTVAGQSVADVTNEIARREANRNEGLSRFQTFRDREADATLKARREQLWFSAALSVPPPTITPSLASTVLGAAGAGLQGAAGGLELYKAF